MQSASTSSRTRTSFNSRNEALIRAVNDGHFVTAFNNIISRGSAAKTAFCKVVERLSRKEMKTAATSKMRTSFPHVDTIKDIESFSWSSIVKTMSNKLPTLYSAIAGSMTASSKQRNEKLVIFVNAVWL